MTNSQYHSALGISASDFRLLEESPLHFHHKNLFKLKGSTFSFGSLVHKMVLEPDALGDEYVKENFDGCDLNKNSTAYKKGKANFLLEAKGKEMITVADWQKAERMAGNVMAIAGGLFQDGVAEMSIFKEDDNGIVRKCRPDWFRNDGVIVDLKTTMDGSDFGFSKSIYEYKYFLQAAWYMDTMKLAGYEVNSFIFVTVEKAAPHMVRVREIGLESIEAGRRKYERLLDDYTEFLASGEVNVIKNIEMPTWAKEKEIEGY